MIHWSGYNWKRLSLNAVLLAPNQFKSLVIDTQMSCQLNCLVILIFYQTQKRATFEPGVPLWRSLPLVTTSDINVMFVVRYLKCSGAMCPSASFFSRGRHTSGAAQSTSLETASSSLMPQKAEGWTNCLIQKHFHLCSKRLPWNNKY